MMWMNLVQWLARVGVGQQLYLYLMFCFFGKHSGAMFTLLCSVMWPLD